MRQNAVVVEKDGRLMARVVRSEACASCRACDFGQKQEMDVELPEGNYTVGQEIELELSDGSISTASLIAYGIPLLGFLLGLGLGVGLAGLFGLPADMLGVIGALVCTAIAYLIVRILDKRIRKSGRFQPRCTHGMKPEGR